MGEIYSLVPDKERNLYIKVSPVTFEEYTAFGHNRYDKQAMNIVLTKHVLGYANGEGETVLKDNKPIPFDLASYRNKPQLLKVVVDSIFDLGRFDLPQDEYHNMVTAAKDWFRTYEGACDLFVLLHGGIDMFEYMMQSDNYHRTKIIGACESLFQVDVWERFQDAVKNAVPLDLSSPMNAPPPSRSDIVRRKVIDKKLKQQGVDTTDLAAVDSALKQAMRQEKTKPKKTFEWTQDTQEELRFENDINKQLSHSTIRK